MSVGIDEKGEMYVEGVSETGLYIADDGCNDLGLLIDYLLITILITDSLSFNDYLKNNKNLFLQDNMNLNDILFINKNLFLTDSILINDIINYISILDKTFIYGNIEDIIYLEGNINRNT